jgi:hypothetical protein
MTPPNKEQIEDAIDQLNSYIQPPIWEEVAILAKAIASLQAENDRLKAEVERKDAFRQSTEWHTLKHHLWFHSAPGSRIRVCWEALEAVHEQAAQEPQVCPECKGDGDIHQTEEYIWPTPPNKGEEHDQPTMQRDD